MSHLSSLSEFRRRSILFLFFTGHLEFILESNLSLVKLDVCHSRHPICLILPSLGVMSRVPIALHLLVVHDDITRQLANCYENYKFSIYLYSTEICS